MSRIDRRVFLATTSTLLTSLLAPRLAPSASAADAPAAIAAYERQSGGRIGFVMRDVATGATAGWRADERFAMCSTFKASLAACVLSRIDRGEDRLDAMVAYGPQDLLEYAPAARANLAKGAMSVAEMCAAAVELSDNTCANMLLARIGGPAALTRFWRGTGDPLSRLDHNEPDLNRSRPGDAHDTTTPAAMAATLQKLVLGDALSPSSRARFKGWLVGCTTGGNRLRGGLPSAWTVGDKTGNNGKDAFGDIAVAWPRPDAPVVICVYTQGGAPDAATVTSTFAEIGRLAGQRFG